MFCVSFPLQLLFFFLLYIYIEIMKKKKEFPKLKENYDVTSFFIFHNFQKIEDFIQVTRPRYKLRFNVGVEKINFEFVSKICKKKKIEIKGKRKKKVSLIIFTQRFRKLIQFRLFARMIERVANLIKASAYCELINDVRVVSRSNLYATFARRTSPYLRFIKSEVFSTCKKCTFI